MKTPKLLVLFAGLAIATAGCGTETGTTTTSNPKPQNEDTRLEGRSFLSTEVTENGKPRDLYEDTRVELRFTDKGELLVEAGCNHKQTTVDTADGRLAITDVTTTEMACQQPLMRQDEWVVGVLESKPTWKLDHENLVVSSGDTELVFADKADVEPDLPLERTKWRLNSMEQNTGGAVVSTGGEGIDKAWFSIRGTKVTGFGGCNTFSGKVEVSAGSLEFEPIISTRRACADQTMMDTENQLLAMLEGTVEYDISETSLDLTKGKNGLSFEGTR